MSDHSYYEELAALMAGGHLSAEERSDLHKHLMSCADCSHALEEFSELSHFGLPLAQGNIRQGFNLITTRLNPGAKERFIERAKLEGVVFSPEVEKSAPTRNSGIGFLVLSSGALAAAIIAASIYLPSMFYRVRSQHPAQSSTQPQQQLDGLRRENSNLNATVSQLKEALEKQQRESQDLRLQVEKLTASSDSYRRQNEQTQIEATNSANRTAQSLELSQAQEKSQAKLLADTQAELARISQERIGDQLAAAEDRNRMKELSDRLQATTADLNLERQLASAGRDVRELMGARQLHIVDVSDTSPDGKTSKAFGRVFLTEGKSLIFYAFDLNEGKLPSGKHGFEVWGTRDGKKGPAQSLGFMYVDDKAQKRWALKVENPDLLKEIDSVFVTVESRGDNQKPSGQPMLYAYLGEANHP
jgi:hypothetical protein